jgi:hypothetical protein
MGAQVTLRGLVRAKGKSQLDVECRCGTRAVLDPCETSGPCPGCGHELEIDLSEVVRALRRAQPS